MNIRSKACREVCPKLTRNERTECRIRNGQWCGVYLKALRKEEVKDEPK